MENNLTKAKAHLNIEKNRKEFIENFWLGLGDVTQIQTRNVFDNPDFRENPTLFVVDLMRQPEYFHFTCKHLFGIQIDRFQSIILQELWKRPMPLLMGTRGMSKTFILGLYALLRCLFSPGSKVVIVGGAFRQAKAVFDVCQKIYHNSPILQNILSFNRSNKPATGVFQCTFPIGLSNILAIPLGDGSTIRGIRACVHPSTIIETNRGLMRIEDYEKYINDEDIKVYTDLQGNLEQPSHFVITKPIDAYKIKTVGGYSLICSDIHKIMTVDGWKFAKDLQQGDKVEFSLGYIFPVEYVKYDGSTLNEDTSWTIGYLLGDKKIPNEILMSPKSVIINFLAGLFYARDSVVINHKKELVLTFSTTNNELASDIHVLLAKLGFLSELIEDKFYIVRLTGEQAFALFKILKSEIREWERKWEHLFDKYSKVTQLHKPQKYIKIKSVSKLNEKISLRDFTIPESHSFRGGCFINHNTHLISDERNSISTEIFDVVIRGFASVTAEPVENVKKIGRFKALQELGVSREIAEDVIGKVASNQIVIAGTPGYCFEPLYRDYSRHKAVIDSRGNRAKLEGLLDGELLDAFSHKDYSVIRIPYDMVSEGFMDIKTIADARSKVHFSLFASEYGVCFIKDTDGFFPRSLIERCVAGKPGTQLIFPSCGEANFIPKLSGDIEKKYVYGIDPASEGDNFTIVILEVWPDHKRIVYCWSINRSRHKKKLKRGIVEEHDYYQYCARKIRSLMKTFPPMRILLDAQQGGRQIMEILGDPKILQGDDTLIYEIEEENVIKWCDGLPGQHIVQMVQFANAQWTADANHGMKFDFEVRNLIFPVYNSAILGTAIAEGEIATKNILEDGEVEAELFDSLETVILEIEDIKNELVTIEVTLTENGNRERWDTPKIKGSASAKKGKLRKDRYSALLMANSYARTVNVLVPQIIYKPVGGVAQNIAGQGIAKNRIRNVNEPLYTGVGADKIDNNNYGMVVVRK